MSTLSQQLKSITKAQQRKAVAIAVLLCPALVIGFLMYNGYDILLVLALVTFLGMMVLMFAQPEATTLIVLFAMYANLAVVATRSYNIPEVLAASFFLLLGLPILNYVIIRRQRIVTNRVFFLMLAYLGVLLVSAVASRNTGDSIARILSYLVEGLVLYFLIINTVRTPALLRGGIWALILAGTLMGSISLYQELTGSYDNDFGGLAQVKESEIDTGETNYLGQDIKRRRLAGPIGSKNRYAQVMVVLLPLALFRAWAERSRLLRAFAAVSCIPIMSGALLTFSRGAGISVVITLLAMVFLRTIKLWHFLVIALLGCLIVLVAIPDYMYRISTVADLSELPSGDVSAAGSSIRGRTTVNLAALNIFLDHAILGVGPGQTNLYTSEYGNELGIRKLEGNRRAHNMYLEELADTGILGFTILMSIVLFTIHQLAKVRRRWARSRPDIAHTVSGFLLAIIAYLSTAVFLHLSYVRYFWLLLALAGAVVYIFSAAPVLEAGASGTDEEGATQGAPGV